MSGRVGGGEGEGGGGNNTQSPQNSHTNLASQTLAAGPTSPMFIMVRGNTHSFPLLDDRHQYF